MVNPAGGAAEGEPGKGKRRARRKAKDLRASLEARVSLLPAAFSWEGPDGQGPQRSSSLAVRPPCHAPLTSLPPCMPCIPLVSLPAASVLHGAGCRTSGKLSSAVCRSRTERVALLWAKSLQRYRTPLVRVLALLLEEGEGLTLGPDSDGLLNFCDEPPPPTQGADAAAQQQQQEQQGAGEAGAVSGGEGGAASPEDAAAADGSAPSPAGSGSVQV